MKFAIVGAGAIGGLLGAKLALAGEDVTFIARNKNLAAIAANGFRLIDEAGVEHHAASAKAVGDAAAIGAQDVVLLTVKAHQVKDVLAQLTHLVGPQTMLVTMINGLPWWYFQGLAGEWNGRTLESVDPGGALAEAIDPARVIGAIVYPAAELVAPGVVRAIEGNRFTIGEPSGERTARIEALSKALMGAGFKAPIARDIRTEIWVKLWGNLSFNPVSALTGATLEAICRDADGRALVAAMMKEGEAVAEPARRHVQDLDRSAHRRRRGGRRAQDLDAAGRAARPAARARGAGRQRRRAGAGGGRGGADDRGDLPGREAARANADRRAGRRGRLVRGCRGTGTARPVRSRRARRSGRGRSAPRRHARTRPRAGWSRGRRAG